MFENLQNSHGEILDCSYAAANVTRRPPRIVEGQAEIVIIGHGVTGNKDREWAVKLASALNSAGFATLRFSFSGNGDSEGRFEDSCPSKEVEDLNAVLKACENWHVTFVGHSMGAAVGVICASQNARIKRLISLAGMVHTGNFAQRKFGDLQAGVDCMWEKPECPLSQTFLDDMHQIDTVLPLTKTITVPWLLVHGTHDDVVPIQESLQIAEQELPNTQLTTLPGSDHVFSDDAVHGMALAVLNWLDS